MFSFDAATWATAIELPVLGGLFWMIQGLRQSLDGRIEAGQERDAAALARLREDLAAFKVEVARSYVPIPLIRDVDRRLSLQLIRIEEKLDAITRARRDS